MYSFLTSHINEAHRRDLLREAATARVAQEARQARMSSRSQRRALAHTTLFSVDEVLYQASAALSNDEAP